MELIPILSLIILVATISTFVLAVGAYVLYKIRERKGRIATSSQPATIEAELIIPSNSSQFAKENKQFDQISKVEITEPTRVTEIGFESLKTKVTSDDNFHKAPMRPTFIGNAPDTRYTEERFIKPTADENESKSSRKFVRYQSQEFNKTEKTQNEEDKLKWR